MEAGEERVCVCVCVYMCVCVHMLAGRRGANDNLSHKERKRNSTERKRGGGRTET